MSSKSTDRGLWMCFAVLCVSCRWWRRTACGRCWFCPIRWSFTPLYPLSLHISHCTPRHNQPCCTIHRFTPPNSLLTTFTSCLRFLSSLSRVSRSTHYCTHRIHLVYRSCATDWLVSDQWLEKFDFIHFLTGISAPESTVSCSVSVTLCPLKPKTSPTSLAAVPHCRQQGGSAHAHWTFFFIPFSCT